MKLLKIEYEGDGFWIGHNYPCPIYGDEHSVYNINTGLFEPSWKAQKEGWMLIKVKSKRLRGFINWLVGLF